MPELWGSYFHYRLYIINWKLEKSPFNIWFDINRWKVKVILSVPNIRQPFKFRWMSISETHQKNMKWLRLQRVRTWISIYLLLMEVNVIESEHIYHINWLAGFFLHEQSAYVPIESSKLKLGIFRSHPLEATAEQGPAKCCSSHHHSSEINPHHKTIYWICNYK